MNSELVIDVQLDEVSIAVLEDKKLVEIQKEACNLTFAVGNIYYGKVRKLMPGLNAAFIDVGYNKDAFLHFQDLGLFFGSLQNYLKTALADKKKIPPISKFKHIADNNKEGSITDQLSPGDEVLVQITKEPMSTKGPRLTSEITFAGRYLVAIPFADKVSVSQKIKSSEERARLKQLIQSIRPKNFGVIVRTSAEGKRVAELDSELKTLVKRWEDSMAKLIKAKSPPALIFEETARTVVLLRDFFNPSYQHIYVNDEQVYQEVKDYVTHIAPDCANIVHHFSENTPIFDHFGVTKQIKSGLGKAVTFKSGAYLVIEHTEALHVIDVNSGNRSKSTSGQENTAFEVNLAAADEIARQLRLRDMGGIIVVDFIDMQESENRQKLLEHMQSLMSNDRARHNILPLSKFGLMQITRQRVRPVLDFKTSEICPTCLGKQEIQSSIFFTDLIEKKIGYIVQQMKIKKFDLHIHPYIEAYINKGGIIHSLKWKWKRQFSWKIKIIPNQNLGFLEYRFYDSDKNVMDIDSELFPM